MNLLKSIQIHLQKPYNDLEFLLLALGEVLRENGEFQAAEQVPLLGPNHNALPDIKSVQMYSLVFQLINMVEINAQVQNRRKDEDRELGSVEGLWAEKLSGLKSKKISEQSINELLLKTHIEPVLTAHPTEAKRSTVLEQHRELYLELINLENPMFNQHEKKLIREKIKSILFRLWKTGEIYIEKPDVSSELRNVIHYLVNVFPDVLPIIDDRLKMAWQAAGFAKEPTHRPSLSFGNWVGGDRDGHPLVTAEVTQQTLNTLRLNAIVVVLRQLTDLVKKLSFTAQAHQVGEAFALRMNQMCEELAERGTAALARNKNEAFRQFVGLMIAKLPVETKRGHATELDEHQGCYQNEDQLLADLHLLGESLLSYGSKTMVSTLLHDVIRKVQTFGFHLAHLDIRQNSAFYEKAIEQILQASGLEENNYSQWDEQKRLDFICQELKTNRPFLHPKTPKGENATEVVDCFRVVASHIHRYGKKGLGSCIVSMTRSASDLMLVYLFQREAGLLPKDMLPVVPLFETITDLEQATQICRRFFDQPFVKSLTITTQQIMVGYSDSNKDGGILASQWSLHKAQLELTNLGKEIGVEIYFFHGKGGSISRGAGPTNYFLDALPSGSLTGKIRLTEQGETIAQKYANKINAAYHLELLLAGTLSNSLAQNLSPKHPQWDLLDKLSNNSYRAFKSLIDSQGFMTYFRQATPIDAIEMSKIGSRPSKRTGANTLQDLRAIPWVFAWGQSRHNMTGWYGVGTALESLGENQFAELKVAASTDPFIRYVLSNVDTSLALTDTAIMSEYAELVEDQEVGRRFLAMFEQEFRKTQGLVNDLFLSSFEVRKRKQYYSNLLKNNLLTNLHKKQISLLKQWRRDPDPQFHTQLLITINAISSGLGNTG